MPDPADDPPTAVAANLIRIRRSLPATWQVSQLRRDATGCWCVELKDEHGLPTGKVVLWPGRAHEAEVCAEPPAG